MGEALAAAIGEARGMDTSRLTRAVAALPASDRETVEAIALTIEAVVEQLGKIAKALELLDQLDDQRAAEIHELRLTVRLLAMINGLETKGEPLAELPTLAEVTAAGPPDAGQIMRTQEYWDQLAELRRQREEAERDA